MDVNLLVENIIINPYIKDEDANRVYALLNEKRLGNKFQRSSLPI